MHLMGVVHRDLKPANLVLSKDHQTLKVVDFGIAKDAVKDVTSGGQREFTTQVGTMQWQSPEQVNGLKFTLQSEYFALGMNIMAFITGTEPFEDARKWILCEWPARDKYKVNTFAWLVHPIVAKCLKSEPSERP